MQYIISNVKILHVQNYLKHNAV